MKILLLGDCHGRLDYVKSALEEASGLGVERAIHVGDFGLYPEVMDRWRYRFPVRLDVIPGNHENHQWLFHMEEAGLLKTWATEYNLYVHRQPTQLDVDGRKINLCGYALNADRPQSWAGRGKLQLELDKQRRPPSDPAWCNFVSVGILKRAAALGACDLMVTHSCPHSIGVGMVGLPSLIPTVTAYCDRIGMHSGPITDCGEPGLTDLWYHLRKEVQLPKNWAFGHFHNLYQKVVGATLFTCVGCSDRTDGVLGSRAVFYDTQLNDVEVCPDLLLGLPSGSVS